MSVVDAELEYMQFLVQSERTSRIAMKTCLTSSVALFLNVIAASLFGWGPLFWVLPVFGVGLILWSIVWLHQDKKEDRRLKQNIANVVWEQT